jgi:hypothetical protein
MVAAERQAWRVQQADHRRAARYALLDPLGVEQIATLGAQAGTWREYVQIVENRDDFMLPAQHFSHQRAAEAGHGTIEHYLHRRGFGIFHG